ncbi:MAG: hypothetical protein KC777_19215 [Cyanobacteria bacterium HKST-UBA02]|nr:hypothetical protein [Cyanobacteria bacterium HKST-UBA02]
MTKAGIITLAALTGLALMSEARAQHGSPIPGNNASIGPSYHTSSPIPGAGGYSQGAPNSSPNSAPNSAPVPGAESAPAPAPAGTIYSQLPLSSLDAKNKIEELSNRLAVSNPDQVKDGIFAISEWLQDVADAHWKMYKAFEKSDTTHLQAKSERETALEFSRLKNRAKLLKADLFIKMNRYPEALGPLVDIVVAEPKSETGQAAYKRLIDMGFSKQIAGLEIAASENGK